MRLSTESYEQILAALRGDSHAVKDKRREPRVGLAGEVDYVTVDDKGKRTAGSVRIRDISRGGIGLVFSTELAPKQRFVLQLYSAGKEPRWLICLTAHCRRCEGGFFSVGAKINQVLKADEIQKIEAQAAANLAASLKNAPVKPAVPQPKSALPQSDIERISKAILG